MKTTLTWLLASTVLAALTPAHAQQKIRMMLNWKPEGTNAPFYYALDKGYYKAAGLDVTLDAGEGSSAPVARIASGAYDAGFADPNTMIRYDAANTEGRQIAVMMIYNRSPFTIITKTSSGIKKPTDLVGKSLAAPANDAAWQMFPALAAATGLDITKVEVRNVAPNLRDALIARGDADAGTGFDATSWFAMKGLGIKFEDMNYIYYADYGINLYSNALIVSEALVRSNPDAVGKFVAASLRAWMETIHDKKPAMDALMSHEALLDRGLETEKLQWVIDRQITSDESKRLGFGAVDRDRLEKGIALLQKTFSLPRTPSVDEVWTEKFLPPIEQRRF